MVRSVEVDGNAAHVRLTPTYTGCPATEQIRSDVEAAVLAAGYEPSVEFVMSPPWSTDDITDQGPSQAHRATGIAPLGAAADGPVALDLPARLPPLQLPSHPSHIGLGATACKALHMCDACRQPFESFKAI